MLVKLLIGGNGRLKSETAMHPAQIPEVVSFYISKIEELSGELRQRQEQLDEVWVRYSRHLQRTKSKDQEQLKAWEQRSTVLKDQNKALKHQLASY